MTNNNDVMMMMVKKSWKKKKNDIIDNDDDDDNLGIIEDNNCKWADSSAWTCSSPFDDELPM